MNDNLFDHVNIDKANTHVPCGVGDDPAKNATDYEQAIERAGGIDLQFMGGAYNPHLGSAIALVMIILIFICMWIMNKFDDGSSEEGGLLL